MHKRAGRENEESSGLKKKKKKQGGKSSLAERLYSRFEVEEKKRR